MLLGAGSAAVTSLLKAGADPEVREEKGMTPSEYAEPYAELGIISAGNGFIAAMLRTA